MVSLPLQGKMGSLNVSVSAGILLYEAVRQRAAAGTSPPARPSGPAGPPDPTPARLEERGPAAKPPEAEGDGW